MAMRLKKSAKNPKLAAEKAANQARKKRIALRNAPHSGKKAAALKLKAQKKKKDWLSGKGRVRAPKVRKP